MLIRPIKKSDFDYIISVLDDWWGGPSRELAHPIFFYEFGNFALAAEDNGEVVGFLFGLMTANQVAYVHLVGIHPERRRHGVGQSLYAAFVNQARKAGATLVKAITTPGNEGSIAFHRAMGFDVALDPNYAGPQRPRVVFQRKLDESIFGAPSS